VRDISAAGDHDALWHRFQVERFVGGDTVLDARAIRDLRVCAGCDENRLSTDFSLADANTVWARHDGTFVQYLDALILQRLSVQAADPSDLREHVVTQRAPIESGLVDVPAEASGVLEILGEMRSIDEQLLRYAAADDARAADAVFLRDGDLGAVSGRDARRAHATRTGADDEQIVVHGSMLQSLNSEA